MLGLSIIDFMTCVHSFMNVSITIGSVTIECTVGQIPSNIFELEILTLEYKPAEKLFVITAV